MIGRLESMLRLWRRRLSRSEWLARLLGLPVSAGTATAPGLVMIQIDGLAHRELTLAIERGELPFLRRLIEGDEPLLAGGSSYANNFTGGAAEPHFCASFQNMTGRSTRWRPSWTRSGDALPRKR